MASGPTPSAEPTLSNNVTPTAAEARGEHGSAYTPAVSEVRQSTGMLSKMRRRLGSKQPGGDRVSTTTDMQSRTRELGQKKSNGAGGSSPGDAFVSPGLYGAEPITPREDEDSGHSASGGGLPGQKASSGQRPGPPVKLTHVTYTATDTGRCSLLHGTVYADPYPGYVHGSNPAICKHGCKPVLSKQLGETAEQRLWREAAEFVDQYAFEMSLSDEAKEARKKEIFDSLAATGAYEHSFAELQWGVRVAWRNSSKSAHRNHWNELMLLDHRSAKSPADMFEGCKELLERASQHRGTVPYLCAFAPRVPGARDGPRVWNDQLVRFACYERSDETLLGDPANKAFTDFVIRALGWKPPARRTAFDVLPLVLQAGPGEDPALYELPPWYVSRISIKHSAAPWLSDMGVKWNAVLLEASTELMLGGLVYTAVPFSGWYSDSDVVQELTDPSRYNLCKPIADAMGLDTRSDGTLWKDKAMHLVNEAVVSSYQSAGWKLVDHHTLLSDFYEWYKKEKAKRGYCPGDFTSIMPTLSPSLASGYKELASMNEYTLLPAYVRGPDFDSLKNALKEARISARGRSAPKAKAVCFNPYVARFIGIMRRTARMLRPNLVIVYASVTGHVRQYAYRLASLLGEAFDVTIMPADAFKVGPLEEAEAVIQMTSTWGAGAAPPMARGWLAYLNTADAREAFSGKPWATLGFGQKVYPRFCAAAEVFLQMAAEARVKNLQDVGKCNCDGNEEADFRLWVSDLLEKYVAEGLLAEEKLEEMQAPLLLDQADAMSRMPSVQVVPCAPGKKATEDINRFAAPVKSSKQLLDEAAAGERATTLVTLDLGSLPYLQYSPGDYLVMYPENSPKVVQDVASNLGISGAALDSLFTLEPVAPNAPEPFPGPITFRNALANYMDLDARPSPAALAVFADCIEETDAEGAEKLQQLASSSQEYQRWVVKEQPRWRDVWSLFSALQGRLPIERLFELCPTTAPRYYSISSSLFAVPEEVAVTVSQLAYHLPDGRKRKGLASTYLTACQPGDTVHFSIVSSPSFHLPMDPSCPAIFVAAGTGIAPFRSFWMERSARARYATNLAPAVLFFGCRSKAADCLFHEELERAKTTGGLSDIIYCFSQEPGMPRTYVQDGIDINADRLAALLATPNAHYYLSGDATMAASVAAVLQKAIGPEMAMRMQSEGRWHENIFGATKASKADAASATTVQTAKLKRMEWDAKARRVLLALRSGNMKTVRLKIEKLSEEERAWTDCDGRTFLHYVVLENKPKLVAVVNVLTVQAHIADHFSLTPRALAVVRGFDECASMLEVLEGPLVSSMNQDFYPVHAAILRRDTAAVKEALDYGVRFSKQDSEGNLPLHCAVAANDLDIVSLLLAKGAPVNLPNRAGRSPTQVALLLGFSEMASVLREAGGIANFGQNKHADFSVTGSIPDAAAGARNRNGKLTAHQVACIQASWGYLTASDFPEKTRDRVVDLGIKIFHALFKKSPDTLRLFNFRDADGRPIVPELRKHALKTFIAFGDVIDGLDNADKTTQIFEHLVRAHFKHGVKAEHYSLLNSAVVATMEASLGEAWDEEQEDAWTAFASVIMSVVSKAYAAGTNAESASMRQATEALARNASYRPRTRPVEPPAQRPQARGQGAQNASPPQARPQSRPQAAASPPNGAAAAAAPPAQPAAANGALAAQQAQVAAVQQQAAQVAARNTTPRGAGSAVPARSAEREGAARTVIRAVTSQQSSEQADAAERRNTEAARVTDLQLAQQQAQARKLAEAQAALGQSAGAGAKRYILNPSNAGSALPTANGAQPAVAQAPADAVARVNTAGKSVTPDAALAAQANGRPAAQSQE